MKDMLLEKFFEKERWQRAITKACDKNFDKGLLIFLSKPETRAAFRAKIVKGKYIIAPPHAARIPKDTPGEFRTVFINESLDRIFLSIANDLLFDTCQDMIHPACRSYLRGTGCGDTVRQVSSLITRMSPNNAGWKSDLSKYFDSVPLRYIDACFDEVEKRTGPSMILDIVRAYYHSNLFFDETGELASKYQSLKQGCAVSSFLADAALYRIDEILTEYGGFYRRYSDDMIFIGEQHREALVRLEAELAVMGMRLNPAKIETIDASSWFKFLGFSIRGDVISLSRTAVEKFTRQIKNLTVKKYRQGQQKAAAAVQDFLYHGYDGHGWAATHLRFINCRRDIETLNAYVMDGIRACATGNRHIGGVGYNPSQNGCLQRNPGKNVSANRAKTKKDIEGYTSLMCARNAMTINQSLFNAITA